jgi:hypothetical protein
MGNPHSTTGPILAISGSVWIIEIIIVLAIVALLVAVFVLYRRQNAPAKPENAGTAQSYYADVSQLGGDATAAQGDPFGGFSGAPSAPAAAPAPAPAPVAAPPAPAPVAAGPAPGTPAGWLPDPSGVPDTLRYWDGNAWTQHVAQRS